MASRRTCILRKSQPLHDVCPLVGTKGIDHCTYLLLFATTAHICYFLRLKQSEAGVFLFPYINSSWRSTPADRNTKLAHQNRLAEGEVHQHEVGLLGPVLAISSVKEGPKRFFGDQSLSLSLSLSPSFAFLFIYVLCLPSFFWGRGFRVGDWPLVFGDGTLNAADIWTPPHYTNQKSIDLRNRMAGNHPNYPRCNQRQVPPLPLPPP